ncbi:winged helix-turn-helix domain-containing protein [Rhizohabitans arisaemae]|uniref:winged helix-turn-helix domain-containing protein n=1 Tax=Rhizohabitans arisaemae TaxID=2720610 RepID=UPI0024B18BAF|nr:crosslink repair DNA glycosylase YcaQ family protein [Rhizohabitans arisaemae]
MTDLSPDDARHAVLRAQGFTGPGTADPDVPAMLRRLGAVQLDTISVLARSHELIAYSRLGALGRPAVEQAYWAEPAQAFEYWCHAACVLPVEHWPYYAFRRREFRERRFRWHEVPPVVDEVREMVRQRGSITTADLGGAKKGGPWWDWSDTKIAIEWLLDIGEVVCTRREGWRRVYRLAEGAIPDHLLGRDVDDAECVRYLTGVAGRALGVATRADLVDFLRLRGPHAALLDEALAGGGAGLVPVRVSGWAKPAWADPAALAGPAPAEHRTTLLSPFDSLIWERARAERIFGFSHRLEAYVPKAKRVHGYFAMPVLAGGELVGRVDPAREGSVLVARQLSFEADRPGDVATMATALRQAASWVGCDSVKVERVEPAVLATPLAEALT